MLTADQYKDERKKRGTQQAVADLLNVHQITITRRETNKMEITEEASRALLSLPEIPGTIYLTDAVSDLEKNLKLADGKSGMDYHNQELLAGMVLAHGIKTGAPIGNLELFVEAMERVTRHYGHHLLSQSLRFGPIVSTLLESVRQFVLEQRKGRFRTHGAANLDAKNNQRGFQSPVVAESFARLESLLSKRGEWNVPPSRVDSLRFSTCPLCLQQIPLTSESVTLEHTQAFRRSAHG